MADIIDTSGNLKFRSDNLKPTVNFNFMLRVEGIYDIPCKSVKVFRKENEYDYIQEGGINDYVHMVRKPISKPFTIQIERYVGLDFVDKLALGTRLWLPMFLNVGRYLHPAFFLPDRQYIFSGCEVISKEYGELNAERSGLLTETTTIYFETMYTINSPFDGERKTWEFDGNSKEGNGDSSRKIPSYTELTAQEMAEKTQRWSMAQNHGGSETRKDASISSRQNLLLEGTLDESVETMTGKRVLWQFDKKSVAGNDKPGKKTRSAQTPITKGIQNDNTPNSESDMAARAALWQFDKENHTFGGIGTTSRANRAQVKNESGTPIGETGVGPLEERGDVLAQRAAQWEFGKDRFDMTGSGKASRMNVTHEVNKQTGEESGASGRGVPETRKAEHEKNAVLWKFDDSGKVEGAGARSRQNFTEVGGEKSGFGVREMTREEMAAKANLWPKVKSAKRIADFLSGDTGEK